VAGLPLPIYRRLADGGKERAQDHYLYPLLHDQPNEEMSAYVFRETMMGHLTTWGNAYAEIEIDGAGRVTGLWPLRPDRMTVKRENGELVYYYDLGKGQDKRMPAWQVFHIPALGFDGLVGYNPIRMQRQAVGLAMSAEEYGGRLFANDATPGAVLEHPGSLTPDAQKNLRESIEARHQGASKSHRLMVLEEGMSWKQMGLPPEDAQFLQTRRFQVVDIARWYRIPPHMLGDLERATFSNIEHQSLEFVVHTIRPWLVRWEQAITSQLLLPRERATYFAEHLVDGLLRGDIQSRYQAYATARQNGWMSANDVRRLENMNPIDDGDMYLMPLNMIPVGQAGDVFGVDQSLEGGARAVSAGNVDAHTLEPEQTPLEARALRSAQTRHRLMMAYRRVYADAAGRIIRRETNDILNAARKFFGQRNQAGFTLWLQEFMVDHAEFMAGQMRQVALAYGELVADEAQAEVDIEQGMNPRLEGFIQRYVEAFASRHAVRSEERIYQVIQETLDAGGDVVETLEAEFDDWRERKPAQMADEESVRFNNALARMVYVTAGRQTLRWVAFGKSCPYCDALNGRVVGINHFFLAAGEDFQPDGAETPLNTTRNVGHAPAHRGCDCMIVAGA